MKYLYLSILFICSLSLTAQNRITGRVVTADNEKVIYRVNIKHLDSGKSITGTFYESNFEIMTDSLGDVEVEISSDGYTGSFIRQNIQPGINNLGEIILYKKAVELQEVVIRAKKSEIEHDGANYTIRNIQGTHIGNAGNLVDMLRWTPGLIVAGADDVKVVGAGEAIVYINERKITSPAELSMLSSTDVSKIEIIREPDARYKNGTKAVVIIYLKKKLKDFLGVTISN